MFKKLHLQLTFFCSLVIGVILVIMTGFCLIISEQGIRNKNDSNFQTNISSLVSYIDNQTVLSHTWLSQMEHSYHMVIDIMDGKDPLLHNQLHSHEKYSDLLALVRETASREYQLDAESFGSSRTLSSQVTFSVYDASHKEYFAAVSVIPKRDSYLDMAVISPVIQSERQTVLQRILFAAGALVSWAILTCLAWFFIRRMLLPIEEGRKKQMQFVASASHELRSPLTVILSALSAAKVSSPKEQTRFFHIMETEGQRMSRLIQDMLALASSDNHSWTMQPSRTEPDTLLLEIYEKYELAARHKGIRLEIQLPDSPVRPCMCDKERITQALSILVENALSYTFRGTAIQLSLSFSSKSCTFEVADNGPGIPDSQKDKIFERFYRADTAHQDKEHFGLGLCIAREIIQLHKGTLRVKDTPGGGATFVVTLPLG